MDAAHEGRRVSESTLSGMSWLWQGLSTTLVSHQMCGRMHAMPCHAMPCVVRCFSGKALFRGWWSSHNYTRLQFRAVPVTDSHFLTVFSDD